MHISMPPQVRGILHRLAAAGFDSYIVGGCVRDSLRGAAPADWDIATAATPDALPRALPDCRIVETGLKHGTVTAVTDGLSVEITTFRVDGAYTDGRRPDSVRFAECVESDLSRRDFTINAMAYNEARGLIDPFGGAADLEGGLVRAVGAPDVRFGEDALRILRAVRFSATLGFAVETQTARSAHALRGRLALVSPERVFAELQKLVCGRQADEALRQHSGILTAVLPEIAPSIGFDQRNKHHIYDVWTHTCVAVRHVGPCPHARLGMLFHDLGKPHTFTVDEKGAGHFYGHPKVSERLARQALVRLRADARTIRTVTMICEHHDRDIAATPKSVRRALHRFGEPFLRLLLEVKRADNLAQSPRYHDRQAQLDEVERLLDRTLAAGECVSLAQLAVNGHDISALGARGAQIGRTLAHLLGRVIDGQLANERGALLATAREHLSRGAASDPAE